MKEHYVTKLKRQLAETEAKRVEAVEALKTIALGKTVNPQQLADKTLCSLGLIAVSFDANIPQDRIFLAPRGSAPITDYF